MVGKPPQAFKAALDGLSDSSNEEGLAAVGQQSAELGSSHTPAGSQQAGNQQAGSQQAGSLQAGSQQAGSQQAEGLTLTQRLQARRLEWQQGVQQRLATERSICDTFHPPLQQQEQNEPQQQQQQQDVVEIHSSHASPNQSSPCKRSTGLLHSPSKRAARGAGRDGARACLFNASGSQGEAGSGEQEAGSSQSLAESRRQRQQRMQEPTDVIVISDSD